MRGGGGGTQYATGTDIDGEPWRNPPSMGCDEYNSETHGDLSLVLEVHTPIAAGANVPVRCTVLGSASVMTVDYGDGTTATNRLSHHAWNTAGSYTVTLRAWNGDHPTGVSATQVVEVIDAVLHVAINGDDENNGLSWAAPKKTIQAAVDVAWLYGQQVEVAAGTYAPSSEIVVSNVIRIVGVAGSGTTIIDGGGSHQCLKLSGGVLLSGFTITGGNASGPDTPNLLGGGVYCTDASPVVSNCVFTGNSADWHGGGMYQGTANNCIFNDNSASQTGGGMAEGTANDCTFTGNSASSGQGGGMVNGTANNCTFNGNSAFVGGGMGGGTANNCTFTGNFGPYNAGKAYGTANNCSFVNNSASQNCGGMGNGTANNCVFFGNSSNGDCGGMIQGTANNCVFFGNSASGDFGGVYNTTATGCTIIGNSASRYGGIARGTANNCIVWDNSTGQSEGNDLYETTVQFTCSPDVEHGVNGCITNAPLFVNLSGDDFHLQPASPCINWGDNASVSGAIDLEGSPRIVENYVDMGCYEYQGMIGEADNDADGMSDAWERQWFGVNVLPDANPDGDHSPNGDEFISGSDPTNGLSYFVAANSVVEVNGTNCFVVEWISIPDRLYSVQWSPSLISDFQTLESGIEHPHSYTDTVHTAEEEGFYKVDVRMK